MEEAAFEPRKPALLLIEDEPIIREHLADVLRAAGYQCSHAGTCSGGRAIFNPGEFACALIDLGLPDGNGLDLLRDFVKEDPNLVTIVLTGDANPDTIIHTMRAGAFDYLTKPVQSAKVQAAVSRATAHHAVMRERAKLIQLLLEEREQLRAKVELATTDIRQYAAACEVSNTRLRALLGLTRHSAEFYSSESLGRSVFEELTRHVSLKCLCLCDVSRRRLLAIYQVSPEAPVMVYRESDMGESGYDAILAEAEPKRLVLNWMTRRCEIDVDEFNLLVFPQTFWNRSSCTVGYFVEPDYTVDDTDQEFLGTCASFFAFEWEQAHLMLQVAHHASLGSIAVELARNFIQPLTAIRTSADLIRESIDPKLDVDCAEGMEVINENVERLRRQTQEFRKLALLREDSVETVKLDDYVEQALQILAVAIHNRNVTIKKQYAKDCECILLNGAALARTFLDLILGSLRTAEVGGTLSLRILEPDAEHLIFEITHDVIGQDPVDSGALVTDLQLNDHPGLQLAERTVHSCGGTFKVDTDERRRTRVRVFLPRNATATMGARELAW